MPNVKIIDRRPFDINMTMQWNDIQELLTRCKRMWASAENPGDFQTLEDIEQALENIANNIRKTLDKS
jgi:muramidase (phage lysozyme)